MCLIIFGVIAYVRIIVNNLELKVRMSNQTKYGYLNPYRLKCKSQNLIQWTDIVSAFLPNPETYSLLRLGL